MSKTSRYCRFKGCKNTSNCTDVHFYRFPKEEKRCQAWVKACHNQKLIGIPASELYIRAHLCVEHFEDWCFMNPCTKHRLVHNAIPGCTKLQDPKLLEKWKQRISNKDKIQGLKDALCEDHFSKDNIIRDFVTKFPDGSVSIKRERPILKPVSVPTQFPNIPSGYSSDTNEKEKVCSSAVSIPALAGNSKKISKNILPKKQTMLARPKDDPMQNTYSPSGSSSIIEIDRSILKPGSKISELYNCLSSEIKQETIPTPEEDLTKHTRSDFEVFVAALEDTVAKPDESWTISYTINLIICAKWDADYAYERHVCVSQDFSVKIFLRNKEISLPDINTVQEIHWTSEYLSYLLLKVDKLIICKDIEQRKSLCLGYVEESGMDDEKHVFCKMCLMSRQNTKQSKFNIRRHHHMLLFTKKSVKAAWQKKNVTKRNQCSAKSVLEEKGKIKSGNQCTKVTDSVLKHILPLQEEEAIKNCIAAARVEN